MKRITSQNAIFSDMYDIDSRLSDLKKESGLYNRDLKGSMINQGLEWDYTLEEANEFMRAVKSGNLIDAECAITHNRAVNIHKDSMG